MLDIRTFYRCPFCPVDRWIVALDWTQFAKVNTSEEQVVSFDLNHGVENPYVLFNPNTADNKPCTHHVSFCIDGYTDLIRPAGDVDRVLDWSADYEHPWLVKHDASREYSIYIWDNAGRRRDAAFFPTTPHRVRRVARRRRSRASGLDMAAVGWFIVAMEPNRFFAELQDALQRLDEHCERTGD